MGPVKGMKKKKKVEKKGEDYSLVSGSSQEDSAKWWDVFSKKIAGDPSSSRGLDKFKYTFNMSLKTFDYICSLVQAHMAAKTHFAFINGKPMSIHDQVALALTRLCSGNSLISIGETFGAHHSTVSQVTWRFVEAVEENGLRHLQWPSTEEETAEIKCKFEKIRGLPNCCGAIDTTHITMLLTSSDREADAWLDRENHYSMVLQAIVGPDLRFRDIVAGWPGQMSAASVLRSSSFFEQCQKGEKLRNRETELREYIIGNSGYPLLPWLITPYRGKKLPECEGEFNKRVMATHEVACKALGRLKELWRIIKGDMWRPDKHRLPRMVLVCCILHNIVIEMEEGDDLIELPCGVEHDPGYGEEVCESVDKDGLVLRDKLCAYFSGL